MNNILKNITLKKPSFLQKIFMQYPEENIVIEINNLLASKPVLSIHENEVKAILSKSNEDIIRKYQLNFIEFYATYLNFNLKLNNFPLHFQKELTHLGKLLSLNKEMTDKINRDFGKEIYRNKLLLFLGNNKITQKEKDILSDYRKNLLLSYDDIEEINKQEKNKIINKEYNHICNNNTISPKEKSFLYQLAIDIDFNLDNNIKNNVERLHKFWQWENNNIIEKGNRNKNVVFYLSCTSQWYSVHSNSVDNNVELHFLSTNYYFSKHPLKYYEPNLLKDTGILYLTNRGIDFEGAQNHKIKFDEIRAIKVFANGIKIMKFKGRDVFVTMSIDTQQFAMYLFRLNRLNP